MFIIGNILCNRASAKERKEKWEQIKSQNKFSAAKVFIIGNILCNRASAKERKEKWEQIKSLAQHVVVRG